MIADYDKRQFYIEITNDLEAIKIAQLIVDTGAVDSCIGILTLKSILHRTNLNPKRCITILDGVSDKYKKKYKSVSGHLMTCVQCTLWNIYIGGQLIPEFHFVVPLDVTSESNLLGLDFISCFDAHIKPKESVTFTNPDFSDYTFSDDFLTINNLFDFDPKEYIKQKVPGVDKCVPDAAISQCKTEEDCEELLNRLGAYDVWKLWNP